MSEDEFQIRVGRIRSRGLGGPRTFVGVALAAAIRAGGLHRASPRRGAFGRGRAASLASHRGLGSRSRGAVVKARVVRHLAGRAPLATHLAYLQREGVTQDGERGELFDGSGDGADGKAFAERCASDRHHFRFIVSPDDAEQLTDLKAFTGDLMRQAEGDLGTRLDWVAVDHWNTAHPHVHVIVRGKDDAGQDLLISRDYISEGLRARAGQLVTLELGPRTDAELRRRLDLQVQADRWTPLDRALVRSAGDDGLIDLRPRQDGRDPVLTAKVARMRHLERLGLAGEAKPGRWRLAPDAERTLRALGRRGDIIARLHRALSKQGLERDPAAFAADEPSARVVGRLVGRGLDDELRGSGYAVIDAVDGRTHHVPLRDLDEAADIPLGGIVEAPGAEPPGRGQRLIVRSDLSIADQTRANGATWLDRQLVGRTPEPLAGGGFGADVRQALEARAERLVDRGLAQRTRARVLFARDLLETLRASELDAAARRLAAQTGLTHEPVGPEGAVAGTYRQRLDLASGRFAVIDNGLGFTLVPWRPELERHLGKPVNGVWLPGEGVSWSFAPRRGLGR